MEKYKSGSLPSVGKANVSERSGLSAKSEVEMPKRQAPSGKKGLGRGMGMGRRQGR